MVCVLDDKVEICMYVGGLMGQELPEPSIFVFFYRIKKKITLKTIDSGGCAVGAGSGDRPSQTDSFGVSTWMGDRLAVC